MAEPGLARRLVLIGNLQHESSFRCRLQDDIKPVQFIASEDVNLPDISRIRTQDFLFQLSEVKPEPVDGNNLIVRGQTAALRSTSFDNALNHKPGLAVL
jgi:hypothetical protein